MTIAQTINQYARPYSPYMSGLVNHLPMGQLALYMMGNDMEKIKSYSQDYVERGKIDPIQEDYSKVDSIQACLGQRDLYQGCLDLVREEIASKGADQVIEKVLNDYPLGMSSGLFHTTIRLAYSVEGMKLDPELTEEVARALAYYLTAYRAGEEFENRVPVSEFTQAVKTLVEDSTINKVISSQSTRGKKIKALYENKYYLQRAPLIDGGLEDKVIALLELLLPLLDETNNILILHCITGLQGLLVLEEYFHDFNHAMDIMTACIITHLLTVENLKIEEKEKSNASQSWDTIIKKASQASNVHTIKFVYSAWQLNQGYKIPQLRQSALTRIQETI